MIPLQLHHARQELPQILFVINDQYVRHFIVKLATDQQPANLARGIPKVEFAEQYLVFHQITPIEDFLSAMRKQVGGNIKAQCDDILIGYEVMVCPTRHIKFRICIIGIAGLD